MDTVIASGFTGQYLLKEAKAQIRRAEKVRNVNETEAEREDRMISQSLLVETMKNWRKVHMPLTMVFAVLVLLHLASLGFFWHVR